MHHPDDSPPNPLPKWSGFFERIDWMRTAIEWLLAEALRSRYTQEKTMATVQELQQSLDALTASTAAAGTAIASEITDLKAAVDALAVGSVVTQAQLDQLNASTAALDAATASLTADDTAPPVV